MTEQTSSAKSRTVQGALGAQAAFVRGLVRTAVFRTAFLALHVAADVYMDYTDIPDDRFSCHRNAFLSPWQWWYGPCLISVPIAPKEAFS